MRWIRVTIHDTSKLVIPDTCPNCLATNADSLVPLRHLVGIASKTTLHWSFCERCSDWVTRPARLRKWFVIMPALFFCFMAVAIAIYSDNLGDNSTSAWLIFSAIIIAFGGWIIVPIIQWCEPLPDSCISNFPTVKAVRQGKGLFSGKHYMTLKFAHPVYVELLLDLHDGSTLTVDEDAMKKAKMAFENQQTNKPMDNGW